MENDENEWIDTFNKHTDVGDLGYIYTDNWVAFNGASYDFDIVDYPGRMIISSPEDLDLRVYTPAIEWNSIVEDYKWTNLEGDEYE